MCGWGLLVDAALRGVHSCAALHEFRAIFLVRGILSLCSVTQTRLLSVARGFVAQYRA